MRGRRYYDIRAPKWKWRPAFDQLRRENAFRFEAEVIGKLSGETVDLIPRGDYHDRAQPERLGATAEPLVKVRCGNFTHEPFGQNFGQP